MKVRIGTVNGDLPCNLSIGKIYDAERIDELRMRLTCDDDQVITTNILKSGYLGDCGSWEIISEQT